MFEKFFGQKIEKIVGKTDYDFVDKELADLFLKNDKLAMEKDGAVHNEEWVTFAEDGYRCLLDTTKTPMYDSEHKMIGVLGVARDITKRKEAEDTRLELEGHLRQKSKMEAVGLLAGGMAHNFNNNLSIVLGNIELLEEHLTQTPKLMEFLNNATIGVTRSRELIQQIMSYSRTGNQVKESINLTEIVKETTVLLRATIPTTIKFECTSLESLPSLRAIANPVRVQEAILNLCNNAVQAMDEKGTLSISVESVFLEEEDISAQFDECKPGPFISLVFSDTGCGIDPEISEKIFDPFFTTKDVQDGTGMGLASVQGFVKDAGGLIMVESIPMEGSTFRLCLPLVDSASLTQSGISSTEDFQGTEHILVIDDEPMVLHIHQRMLEEAGYHVTAETDSVAALEAFRTTPESFDLVISDQSMPKLSGKDLAKELLKLRPDLPIIICTGYSSKIDKSGIKQLGIAALLMKPLAQKELLKSLRSILNSSGETVT